MHICIVHPSLRTSAVQTAPAANQAVEKDHEAAAEALWRRFEYRRIGTSVFHGYAADEFHISKMISAENDYPPPHLPRPSTNELQVSPYHINIDKFKDKDILEELRARTVELPFSDAIWLKIDHL